MTQISNNKKYDLEERTLEYGKRIVRLCKSLSHDKINMRICDQCLRSGTSIGANYREANETETKKDFIFRMRIARKEAKETIYWLELIIDANKNLEENIKPLLNETTELLKIISSIIEKSR